MFYVLSGHVKLSHPFFLLSIYALFFSHFFHDIQSIEKNHSFCYHFYVMSWSEYFQSPYFLERTRIAIMQPEYTPLIRNWCGVKDGVSILDVGCGSGFFTRLLGSGEEDVRLTGVDLDPYLLEYAEKESVNNSRINYVHANALSLPFEDGTFDAVTSHTFLTSVSNPDKSVREMLRVLKPGGILSCVVAMSFENAAASPGYYPKECTWHDEFVLLYNKLWRAYEIVDPALSYAGGLKSSETPRFFATHGLKEISAYPIGKLFSFSNAARSEEDRLKWLSLYKRSEEERLTACMSHPKMHDYFSDREAARYKELLSEKCKYLESHIGENAIWEWYGGVNMLVRGIKSEEKS